MRHVFQNHQIPIVVLLFLGVLSTLALDLWATNEVRKGTWVEMLFLIIAFCFRIITYTALFVSCRLIAEELKESSKKPFLLGLIWSFFGLCLAAVVWAHLATAEEIHRGGAIRFTPASLDLPDWLEEAVVEDRNYTWVSAMTLEAFAIVSISLLVAYFLAYVAKAGRTDAAYFASFLSFICLIDYTFLAPWYFTWGLDIWIGDALLGATIYNALVFWNALLFGGLTGPAVWVGLMVFSNLVLLIWWRRDYFDSVD